MARKKNVLALSWLDTALLGRRRELEKFLQSEIRVFAPFQRAGRNVQAWLGWGCGRSGRQACKKAERDGTKVLLLEDGFLRSFGLAEQGARALSIVADSTGIFYDATRPSDLENILQTGVFESLELERAEKVLELLRRDGLSRYNSAGPVPTGAFPENEERVLLVDQAAHDASLRYGMTDEHTFSSMLTAALEENPDAKIYIHAPPDVLAGQRQGAMPRMQDARIVWLNASWHPHDLLAYFNKVYTATSLMGLDALVLGKEVHCFGMPFYAGWGLTHDRKTCRRRTTRRSLKELVAAAYLRYARYIDPETGEPGDVFAVARFISRQKRHTRFWYGLAGDAWSGRVFAFGFQIWKQARVRPFFGSGKVIFARSAHHAQRLGVSAADRIAVWGKKDDDNLRRLTKELGLSCVRVEDGFIRSVGLGTDFVPPMSLAFDSGGIYYDPGTVSDLERILKNKIFTESEKEEAEKLIEFINDHKITKYNVGASLDGPAPAFRPGKKKTILVPGQVESDASILCGCRDIRTNAALMAAVRAQNPDAYIIYKPHPDVMSRNRAMGETEKQAFDLADHVEAQADILSCIECVDELHTMTSLSGFDALLRGKKVVCYGAPFYAGWGLTVDHISLPCRQRQLSLEELVAGVLVIYPRYIVPDIDGFTSPMHVAKEIANRKKKSSGDRKRFQGRVRKWAMFLREFANGIMSMHDQR